MNILGSSRSAFLETVLEFEGKHLDYNEFFFWKIFWQLEEALDAQNRIGISRFMLGGRQISKSTSLAGEIVCKGHQPYHRMLYIAPQSSLTKAFSNVRLTDMLETPMVYHNLFSNKSKLFPSKKKQADVKIKTKDDILSKRFITGSYIYLTYTDGTDTERVRGYSADDALHDEAQNSASLASTHHVLKYCLRSSKSPRILNVGTPLGQDDFSTTAETDGMFFNYHVKCSACNKEQDLKSLANIDIKRRRIICRFCGTPLDVQNNGRYVAYNRDARLLSMHANMLMLPSLQHGSGLGANTWAVITDTLLDDKKTDDEKKEELLGVPSSAGDGLITKSDLDGLPRIKTKFSGIEGILKTVPTDVDGLIMGIDWGGDSDPQQKSLSEEYMNSHTAFTINGASLSPDGSRVIMKTLYEHTFPLEDPNESLNTIFQVLRVIMPHLLGVATDFGGGFFPNPKLSDFLVRHKPRAHFAKIQLLPALSGHYHIVADHIIKVHKPNLVTEYFRKIKMREIHLTGETDKALKEYYVGALSQRRFITRQGDRLWKKRGKRSDDSFMSALFAYVLALSIMDRTHELKKNS